MLIALLSLIACKQYSTVDEACRDEVAGQDEIADPFAVAWGQRADCYRHFQHLSKARLSESVQIGAEYHRDYLLAHGIPDGGFGYWNLEDPGTGFYGTDVFERLDNGGYDEEVGSYGVIEVLALHPHNLTGDELVDLMMGSDPLWHEFIHQFGWQNAGIATGSFNDYDFTYGVVVYDFPALDNRSYITFPRKDQLDAPVAGGLSITIGGSDTNGLGAENTYDLNFQVIPTLTGPDGLVPLTWYLPGQLGDTLYPNYSAIAYPDAPLEPDTDYTVSGKIEWSLGDQLLDYTFHTSSEGTPTATAARTSDPDVQVFVRRHLPGELR